MGVIFANNPASSAAFVAAATAEDVIVVNLWELVAAIVTGIVVVGTGSLVLARAMSRRRRRRESPTLQLVRRRDALRRELERAVGDEFEASELLYAEAQRLGVGKSSLTALHAALERAKRQSTTRSGTRTRAPSSNF